MPKFRISFSVDSANLGPVLAAVHEYGVSELDFGIVENVPHHKNVKRVTKSHADKRPRKAQEHILHLLAEGPITLIEGRDALNEAGYSGDGIYTMRDALVKRGVIEFTNGAMRLVK